MSIEESTAFSHNELESTSIVMDLFDHGPLLMVIGGQLLQADSLSICINVTNNNPTHEVWHPSTHNTITVTLTTSSDITPTHSITLKSIYLFNNKHKLIFEEAYVSEMEQNEDGSTTIELDAYDYSVTTGWCNRFK
jgi:hypothetical protein